jgi:hypothetical protein
MLIWIIYLVYAVRTVCLPTEYFLHCISKKTPSMRFLAVFVQLSFLYLNYYLSRPLVCRIPSTITGGFIIVYSRLFTLTIQRMAKFLRVHFFKDAFFTSACRHGTAKLLNGRFLSVRPNIYTFVAVPAFRLRGITACLSCCHP